MPHSPQTLLEKYENDTCVFSAHKNRCYAISVIINHFKILSAWFKKWRIAVNVDKTQIIHFCNSSQENIYEYIIKYNYTERPWSPNSK